MAFGKALLKSGIPSPASQRSEEEEIVVMGNGPSLRKTIEEHLPYLMARHRMAVNFAANAPEFFSLRPDFYILADPHFFTGNEKDANVAKLWNHLSAIDWDMTLFLPLRYKGHWREMVKMLPSNVKIKKFNLTPSDGRGWIIDKLTDWGLVMPRPRNVLIPAIMMAIREGFKKIEIVGADHSWLQSLWVDDKNRVVSVQPHFYKDNDKELDRVAQEYAGYHLHDILGSMTIAFKAYFDIEAYAHKKGVAIINATPGSYIDAFRRK